MEGEPKLEKEQGLMIDEKIKERFPELLKYLQKEIVYYQNQEVSSEIREKYSYEVTLIEELAQKKGFRGVLVSPAGGEMGTFPLNFFMIPKENLGHFYELKLTDEDIAKKGLELYLEATKEDLKGKSLDIWKDIFEKIEKILKEEKNPKKIEKRIVEETEDLERLRRSQSQAQFLEKTEKEAMGDKKKFIEDIANFEIFSLLVFHGIERGNKIGQSEEVKKYLLTTYAELEKEVRGQIYDKMREKGKEMSLKNRIKIRKILDLPQKPAG